MRLLRVALALAVLAGVWVLADGQAAAARLAGADLRWLALAFLLVHTQTVLSALRWRMVARAMGMPMPVSAALREYYVAQLGNQTLPGGVAGDAARAVRARAARGLAPAATAVVAERLMGQAALMLVLAVGMALSLTAGAIRWPAVAVPLGGAALLVVIVGAVAVALFGVALARCYARPAAVLGAAWRALAAPTVWPGQALLSVAIVVANLCSFAAAARATGTVLPIEAIVTLVPLILTAMLLALGIAGWGWREGAAAALFPLAGAASDAGLAASAAFGVLLLVAALPGALWLARSRTDPGSPNITVS